MPEAINRLLLAGHAGVNWDVVHLVDATNVHEGSASLSFGLASASHERSLSSSLGISANSLDFQL